MDKNYLDELYNYNRWANHKALDTVSVIDQASLHRDMKNSFSSLHDTLVHILGAEWIWLERWNGRFPRALLDPADFPTLDSVRQRWATVEDEQKIFLARLTPEKLATSLSYINRAGERYTYPLWQQMAHVVNHSSYHRGQVTTLLRQLGAVPVSTDFLQYYDEQKTS